MTTVFFAFRDAPDRRAALRDPESLDRYRLFGLDEIRARGADVRHNLERSSAPPLPARVVAASLNRLLRFSGGYGGDFATVLASLRAANEAEVVFSTSDTVGLPLVLLSRAHLLRPPLVYAAVGLPERLVHLRGTAMRRLYARALRRAETIVTYAQAAPSEEALLVADANDGFDFEQASDELRSLIPTSLRITQVNRGRVDPEMARRSLFEGLYRKQFLVNYVGHGSVNQWRGNLLTNDDALALRNEHLPMFVMMTCLNGYFHDPVLDSLGESLMKAEHGGAVAVWASSGMTLPADQALLDQAFYRLLFNRSEALSIGEAVMRAKGASSSTDVRRTWILLGDPAMRPK